MIGRALLIDTASPSGSQIVRVFENPDPVDGDFFGAGVTFVGGKIAISITEDYAGGVGKVYIYDDAADLDPTIAFSPYPNLTSFAGFGGSLAAYGNDLLVSTLQTPGGNENGAILRYDTTTGELVDTYVAQGTDTNDNLGMALTVSGTSIFASATQPVVDPDPFAREGVVIQFDGEAPVGDNGYVRTIHEPGPEANWTHSFATSLASVSGGVLVGTPAGGTAPTTKAASFRSAVPTEASFASSSRRPAPTRPSADSALAWRLTATR